MMTYRPIADYMPWLLETQRLLLSYQYKIGPVITVSGADPARYQADQYFLSLHTRCVRKDVNPVIGLMAIRARLFYEELLKEFRRSSRREKRGRGELFLCEHDFYFGRRNNYFHRRFPPPVESARARTNVHKELIVMIIGITSISKRSSAGRQYGIELVSHDKYRILLNLQPVGQIGFARPSLVEMLAILKARQELNGMSLAFAINFHNASRKYMLWGANDIRVEDTETGRVLMFNGAYILCKSAKTFRSGIRYGCFCISTASKVFGAGETPDEALTALRKIIGMKMLEEIAKGKHTE